MSLTCAKKSELTIFGYVRLNYKNDIPDDVTRICWDYYMLNVTWDIFCDNVTHCISDDGLEIHVAKRRDRYATFASSVGWNQGIHAFSVQQLDADRDVHDTKRSRERFHIGIISSDGLSCVKDNDKQNYFMWYKGKQIAFGTDWDDTKHISNNDKVTCVLDCDKWEIAFYVNDKICDWYPTTIIKDKTYHPVITVMKKHSVLLRIVETTIDIEKIGQHKVI